MATPSLTIGDGKWAIRENELLGYFRGEHNKYSPRVGDFTRASEGTITNKDGFIENVPYNLITYSEDFSNSDWTKNTGSVSAVGIPPPTETTTVTLFTADGTADRHFISETHTQTGVFTLSAFIKANTNDFVQFLFGGASTQYANFDVGTGVVGTKGSSVSTSTITELGDGWYFCTATIEATTNPGSLLILTSSSASAVYYELNSLTTSFYISGAQLDKGTVAKPYFATTDRLDIPRIDFSDNPNGALLLEPQRTNLNTYSEDFNAWTNKTNLTLTSNYNVSPDGTTNADRIECTAGLSFLYNFVQTNGVEYTVSCWAKETSSASEPFGFFRDGSGSVNSEMSLTDEWQRFTYTFTAGTASTIGLAGDTGADVLVFGFQIEVASYPTTYIPTSGSTVTRLADVCNGFGTVNDFNSEEGVLFVEIAALDADLTQRHISMSNGSVGDSVSIYYDSTANRIRGVVRIAGAYQCILEYTVLDIAQFHKIALKYKINDFALWIDGVEVDTDTSGSVLAANVLNTATFTRGDSGSPFYGKTKSVQVFKEALTGTEMELLTSIGYTSYEAMELDLGYTDIT